MQQLAPDLPLADAVRDVAARTLARGLDALDDDGLDVHQRVHEARRVGKEVRGLLRLVRDAAPRTYAAQNARLRDAARLVSDDRDAAAAVETHDALVGDLPAPWSAVREVLAARRDALPDGDGAAATLARVRGELAGVRQDVGTWDLPTDRDGALATLRRGYGRTYGRARAGADAALAAGTAHAWHQWRKRVKYHRYHVDLLGAAWSPVMAQREDQLHDLTDLLGDDHDLAVLRTDLVGGALALDRDVLAGYLDLLDGRRTGLRAAALPLAGRLLHAPTDQHVDLVLAWWGLAVDEADPAQSRVIAMRAASATEPAIDG